MDGWVRSMLSLSLSLWSSSVPMLLCRLQDACLPTYPECHPLRALDVFYCVQAGRMGATG